MSLVRAAIAASTTSAAGIGKSSVWCSPIPKNATPTWSASTPSSTTSRIVWAWERRWPTASSVTSPKVLRPKTRGNRAVVTSGFLSGGGGVHGSLELGSAQRNAEDRAAGSEQPTGAQAVQPDGVVADALDDVRHDVHRARVVARDAEGPALRRADGPAFVLQFVVADLVERLDDRR